MSVTGTAQKASAVLILPGHKEIRYYALDWSQLLRFPTQPHTFEMTNAFVAMKLWKSTLRNSNIDFIEIEVLNPFFEGGRSDRHEEFWSKIDAFRKKIGGNWTVVSKEFQLRHKKEADQMSRAGQDPFKVKYPEWRVVNDNDRAELVLVGLLRQKEFPREY